MVPLLLLLVEALLGSASGWNQYVSSLTQTEELSLSLLSASDAAAFCLGPGDGPLVQCSSSSPFMLQPEPCCDLLRSLANSSAALTACLMLSARPPRPCQSCQPEYSLLQEQMNNLSLALEQENTTEISRCARNLLQCDRMQIVARLNNSFNQIWEDSNCAQCLRNEGEGLRNDSIEFMEKFNATMQCFEQNKLVVTHIPFQEGNYSKVCTNCSKMYKDLTELYAHMQEGNTLCIDIEDAMNSTRILWSQIFKCNIPFYDVVPVVAVSSFILFLPVIFYLSSYLHSEQKKRKLILPKRMRSATNLLNFEDKSS
ncbi:osteopetrosis-associated transmembrane protein 1 [Lissotriton helveticus]